MYQNFSVAIDQHLSEQANNTLPDVNSQINRQRETEGKREKETERDREKERVRERKKKRGARYDANLTTDQIANWTLLIPECSKQAKSVTKLKMTLLTDKNFETLVPNTHTHQHTHTRPCITSFFC